MYLVFFYSSPNRWTLLSGDIDKKDFLYVNEVTFGPHLRMGTGCQSIQPVFRRLEFSFPLPDLLWGGERTWRLNRPLSWLKPPKGRLWRASGLVNMWRCRENDLPGEGMEIPGSFPLPCPLHLFCLAVTELHLSIINQWSSKWNIFLSFVSRSSK